MICSQKEKKMSTNFRISDPVPPYAAVIFKVTFGPVKHLNPSFLICKMEPKSAYLTDSLQGLEEMMLGKCLGHG